MPLAFAPKSMVTSAVEDSNPGRWEFWHKSYAEVNSKNLGRRKRLCRRRVLDKYIPSFLVHTRIYSLRWVSKARCCRELLWHNGTQRRPLNWLQKWRVLRQIEERCTAYSHWYHMLHDRDDVTQSPRDHSSSPSGNSGLALFNKSRGTPGSLAGVNMDAGRNRVQKM